MNSSLQKAIKMNKVTAAAHSAVASAFRRPIASMVGGFSSLTMLDEACGDKG